MLKLQVIGNCGREAQVNKVDGKTVMNFSIAHNEKKRDGSEKTTWVDCSWWSENTKIAEYIKKGTMLFAEGYPYAKEFTKKDGSKSVSLALNIFSVQLLGGIPKKQEDASNENEVVNNNNDDLPF